MVNYTIADAMAGRKNSNKKSNQGNPNRKNTARNVGAKVGTVTGKIDVSKSGLAFVTVEGMERDVLVYPENLNTALKGDTVKVEIMLKKNQGSKRIEGVVREVTIRKQSEFVGRMEVKPTFAFLIPDNDKMPVDIFIPEENLNGAIDGDKAVVKVLEWRKSKNPLGTVLRIVTNESANEMAMQDILSENGFPLDFPDEVMEEAARISDVLDKKEIAKREDFRNTLTLTIDPADAKDFDDAISIKELKEGYYEVGVHIADVSHYVNENTELDKEALNRATSVYLPDRVLPMLPEHLSNQLCSLRPNEEKFTFSAIFTINKQGKVKDYRLGKTIINSNRRFTYEEAQEIIEGKDGDYAEEIHTLDTISKALREQRFKNGAINFSSQEVRFQLDEKGVPVGIIIKESKDAHKLIEELMLLANRYVAQHVGAIEYQGKPLPFPYRVHDTPNEEKLAAFAAFAAKFGYKMSLNTPETITKTFNELLRDVQGKPEQHVLETLGIRTMSKAIYTTENVGHYGLGFEDYCHFTSPIRRYPDVLVHRILHEVLQGKIKPMKGLEDMCKHCSTQERNAMDAERSATKYKQVEFMQQYVGETFDGVVSGVAAFGIFVETIEHKCEGMLPVNDLLDIDRFEFSEQEYALVGRSTGLRFTIGDHIRIKVIRADLDKRQIDFSLAEMPEQKARKPLAKGKEKVEKKTTTRKKKD